MRWGITVAAALMLSAEALPAAADGAWNTMQRPRSYTDLVTEGDTVWCATLEAGLLEFDRATTTFKARSREPGGLASNRLTALALDRSRRLWVGTRGKGVSFLAADRATWSLVNAFDGLPSDSVNVLEASGDSIWIGTTRGFALWGGHDIRGRVPDGINPSPFASDMITGIVELGDDLWLGTQAGVYRGSISGGLETWTAVNGGLPTAEIEGLATDGVSLFALDALRVHRLDFSTSQWSVSGNMGDVYRLSDDRGTAIAASNAAIYRWSGTSWVRATGSPASAASAELTFAATVYPDGRLVAANRNGFYEEPAAIGPWRQTYPPGPPDNDLLNVEIEGPRVYVTTYNRGVGRFDGAQWRYWPTGRTTSDTTFVNAAFTFGLLADKDGRKWVGCWDQAHEVFNDLVSPPQFTHQSTVPTCHDCNPNCVPRVCDDPIASHTFTWAAALDSSNGHWFGMESPRQDLLPSLGLDYYDSAGVYIANYQPSNSGLRGNTVHGLTVTQANRVWVGFHGQGIDYFDVPDVPGGPILVTHVSGTDNLIVEGLASRGEEVWALTTEGIYRYGPLGHFEAFFQIPAAPSGFPLRAIDVAPDGTAWVATLAGIRLCHLNGSYEDITTENSPLADDDVRAIRIDPATKRVWIATAGGLSRYQLGYVPPVQQPERLEIKVYPNPSRLTALGITLRLSGNASGYTGRIHDLSGRVVARFTAGANGRVVWNGRDLGGSLVKPGIYFVSAEAGGRRGTVRVALVR